MNLGIVADIPLEEGLARYDESLRNALNNLQTSGFYMPLQPKYHSGNGILTEYRGELPTDVTSLSDQQLGWYLSMLATWAAYCQTKFAEADINRSVLKEKLEFLEAKLTVSLIGEKRGNKLLSNPQIRAVVTSDRRYLDIKQSLIYWEAFYRITKAATEAAETNWWTVSRRITQKGQALDKDNRVTNAHNVTSGPLFGTRRS